MSLYHYLRRSLLLILPLLFGIFTFGIAYAEQITYSATIPDTPTNWEEKLTLPQFSPNLGELVKVVITTTGTVTGGGEIKNTGPNTANFVVTHIVELKMTLPNNVIVDNAPTVSQTVPIPAGQVGVLPQISSQKGTVDSFVTPADLVPYIGLNMVTLPVTATGNSKISGSGNYDIILLAKAASIVVEITYIYLNPGIDIEKLTNGNDADDPNGGDVPQIPPAGTVNWSYVVKNTGQITFTLAEVQVTDSHTGITPVFDPTSDNGDNLLAPGETWLYRAAGVAQNLLLPTLGTTVVNGCDAANVGNRRATYENIGTVVARNVTDSDPSHYCNPPAPGIVIKKFTNGQDADNANGVDVPLVASGAPLTWTYEVRNTGNISFTLAEVRVTDDQPGVTPAFVSSSDNGDNILSPGESWLYRATGVAQTLLAPNPGVTVVNGCDPGNTGLTRPAYENIGKVVVRSLTDIDPSHYCNPPGPGIIIIKFTNGQDANDPDGSDVPEISLNNTVTWTYMITNTGTRS